jgi:Uma2 family endonuclease
MVVEKKLYTVDEFEAYIALPENRDRQLELIDGDIVEKNVPTERHGITAANFVTEVRIYLKQNPIGRVAVEVRYRRPGDQYNARQPDVSFRADRSQAVVEKGAVPQMPDLAIEIKSPDDSLREMRDRADYYLANGSRMVWLAYPDKRIVEVYTLDDILILTEDDILDGGDVLPGFKMSVRDVFAD